MFKKMVVQCPECRANMAVVSFNDKLNETDCTCYNWGCDWEQNGLGDLRTEFTEIPLVSVQDVLLKFQIQYYKHEGLINFKR